MSSDFKAFDATAILTLQKQKVQDIVCWDDRLLAALGDGTLLVIGCPQSTASPQGQSWQVQRTLKGFGKKYLLNLQVYGFSNFSWWHCFDRPDTQAWLVSQVVPSRTALLSASEDGINLHTLPRLQLTAQVSIHSKAPCRSYTKVPAICSEQNSSHHV